MIKEFKDELQAKAIADSLGLLITKYRGVYTVSNSKEELLINYNLGYFPEEGIFYDKEVFEIGEDDYLCIKNKEIIDASSIELPYSIKDCSYMFWACISLEIPPIIPEGVKDCFSMFEGCTSIVTPPILPDGVQYCSYMFNGCISLETPPKIPEGVLNCQRMFRGCISLKSPPNFPENCCTIDALKGTPFENGSRPKFPAHASRIQVLAGTPFWQSSAHHGSLNIFP